MSLRLGARALIGSQPALRVLKDQFAAFIRGVGLADRSALRSGSTTITIVVPTRSPGHLPHPRQDCSSSVYIRYSTPHLHAKHVHADMHNSHQPFQDKAEISLLAYHRCRPHTNSARSSQVSTSRGVFFLHKNLASALHEPSRLGGSGPISNLEIRRVISNDAQFARMQ